MTFDIRLFNAGFCALLTAILGVYPFIRKRDHLTAIFAASNIALAFWNLGDLVMVLPESHLTKLFLFRANYVAGVLVVWCFYRFILAFAKISISNRSFTWNVLLGVGLMLSFLFFTPLMIRDIDETYHPFKELVGPAFPLFIAFLIGGLGSALFNLFGVYREAKSIEKNKLKYMFVALFFAFAEALFYFCSVYDKKIPTYYFYLQVIYVLVVSYAIFKHQLMDINIVIRKTLLYSIVTAGMASLYAGGVALLARIVENRALSHDVLSFGIFTSFINNPKFYSIGYITGLISVMGMGIFVVLARPRRTEARLWSILSFLVAVWFLGRFMVVQSIIEDQAFFWQRVMYFGAIYLNIVYFHFVMAFVGEEENKLTKAFLWTGYAVSSALLLTNLTSRLFIRTMENDLIFRFYEHMGPLYPIHLALYLFYPGMGILRLAQERRRTTGARQNQVDYIIAASIIGFFCGASTFPLIFGIKFPPIGAPFVPIYAFIIVYAIVAHRLMDITIIIRKTLLYSVLSAALASVYVGTITIVAQVLGARQGSASVFSSALAAIFITLLFNPLRIKTQHWIDRQFPREHLDPDLLQEAAGSFAHEMKRPLTKISFPAQLALMELEQAKKGEKTWEDVFPLVKDRLQFIINQSMDAGYVIEAIRELSSAALPFEQVNLKHLVEEALNANKDLLEKYCIFVDLHLPTALPAVLGRARQLEIVFVNLIKNAAEAMKDLPADKKRQLRIEGESNQSHVILRVIDTGVGVKSEDADKLFSARYSTKGQSGTGLGLYLSRQIIQAHSGTIEVSSQSGTTFAVRLPMSF